MVSFTLSVEEEVGVSRTGWLRGGEREGDEACPVVDHRDLRVDMETTGEWPPADNDRVSENLCCFFFVFFNLLCLSVRTHKHIKS